MTLVGFEPVPATNPGGSFNGSPWKICLHTTEGSSVEGAIGAYHVNTGWPHFTVDPARGRRCQHYELTQSSRALAHPAGTPETNRAGVINIEIVGFAAQSPTWPKAWLEWLGTAVLSPIRAVCPFDLRAPDFVAYPQSYGLGASQRFSRAQFATYGGIIGHEHAPDNDHGDPGAIDVTAIIAAIGHTDPPVPLPSPVEDDMIRLMRPDNGPTVYAVSSTPSKWAFGDPYLLADYANRFKGQILTPTVGGPTVKTETVNGVLIEVVNPAFLSTIPTLK